jgi:hypothetical protein
MTGLFFLDRAIEDANLDHLGLVPEAPPRSTVPAAVGGGHLLGRGQRAGSGHQHRQGSRLVSFARKTEPAVLDGVMQKRGQGAGVYRTGDAHPERAGDLVGHIDLELAEV